MTLNVECVIRVKPEIPVPTKNTLLRYADQQTFNDQFIALYTYSFTEENISRKKLHKLANDFSPHWGSNQRRIAQYDFKAIYLKLREHGDGPWNNKSGS